ncbi:MAG: extracellular solute-binding protein [Defluviitaleaceae bacterium]|nr:extracellular solute-binding protein [Defluviitaleaceae bacterium]
MKKRAVTAIAALVLCFTLLPLAGCAGNNNPASAPPSDTTATAPTDTIAADTAAPTDTIAADTAAPSETSDETATSSVPNFNATGYPIVNDPITLTAVVDYDGSYMGDRNDPNQMQGFTQRIKDITGITINWNNVDDSVYEEQMPLMFASGDLPDFFWDWIDTPQISQYGVYGDELMDWTPYIQNYMPYLDDWFVQHPEDYAKCQEINGGIYSLPYIVSSATSLSPYYMRTDMLAKAGISDMPTTTDQFFNDLMAIKSAYSDNPDFIPMVVEGTDKLDALGGLYTAFGNSVDSYSSTGNMFTDDGSGNVSFIPTSDQYRHFLEYANKLYSNGLFDPRFITRENADARTIASGNNCAVYNQINVFTDANFDNGTWAIHAMQPLTSQYSDTPKAAAPNRINKGNGAMTSKNKYPEATARLLDMFYYLGSDNGGVIPGTGINGIPAATRLWVWLGPEGETWKDNGDGTYSRTLPADLKGLSENGYVIMYVAPGNGPCANVYTNVPLGSTMNEIKAEDSVKYLFPYLKEAFPYNNLLQTTDEQDTIGTTKTNIQTYVDQMKVSFVTGDTPLTDASWNDFVQHVQGLGLSDLLAATQAGYDRFKAAMAAVK